MIFQTTKSIFLVLIIASLQQYSAAESIDTISECTTKTKIPNGYYIESGGGHEYTFFCDNNYHLVGAKKVYLIGTLRSSDWPFCTAKTNFVSSSDEFYGIIINGVLTYFCNDGYTYTGQMLLKVINNQATYVPQCVIQKPQEETTGNYQEVLNYKISQDGYKYTYSCNGNYYLLGPKTIYRIGNTWSITQSPNCVPFPAQEDPVGPSAKDADKSTRVNRTEVSTDAPDEVPEENPVESQTLEESTTADVSEVTPEEMENVSIEIDAENTTKKFKPFAKKAERKKKLSKKSELQDE